MKNTKFKNGKDADKAKKDLENVIDASKIELEETIPEYALKKIEELNTVMDNLKKFEIKDEEPSKPEEPGNQNNPNMPGDSNQPDSLDRKSVV